MRIPDQHDFMVLRAVWIESRSATKAPGSLDMLRANTWRYACAMLVIELTTKVITASCVVCFFFRSVNQTLLNFFGVNQFTMSRGSS